MPIFKTRSFWLAAVMTLICSVAGVLLAKLPYVNLIGALVIVLLLGITMQLAPAGLRSEASTGVGFISNKFLRLGIYPTGVPPRPCQTRCRRGQDHPGGGLCGGLNHCFNLLA